MFQTFTESTNPLDGPPRLEALRAELKDADLDGFLIPRADAHQGEYVAEHDARLAWLTGFTGSAGFCITLHDRAGVFVDGRYRVQVKAQVALDQFTPVNWPEVKPWDWLIKALPNGGRIGFDPWLHTVSEIAEYREGLKNSGIDLLASANPVDQVWPDQPPAPSGKITAYPLEYAGENSGDKRARIAKILTDAGHRAAVLTLPDSICWLLNIRGSDIERNPVAHAFAILLDNGRVQLFTDPQKLTDLAPAPDIDVLNWGAFQDALGALAGPVRLDKASAPIRISDVLTKAGVKIAYADDPCILPKARKNATEIAGTVEAHLRDGAAMVEFLCWLDSAKQKPGLTEIDIVKKLEGIRRATNLLLDISFETICGSGPNGALPHYRVSDASNRTLQNGDLIVIDSGGQYIDGTTDITRTICVGTPGADERAAFTRVLQGMIAVSRARWPRGLAGRDLDPLARYHLWTAGQDFDHGTGHGVGTYLCVHEGPQRIARSGTVPLEPGMILSNEPGYYREGAFGIRTENLCVVQDAPDLAGADARDMLSFMTITFVPIARNLIDTAMLAPAERNWLNAYHAEVIDKISPRLSDGARDWLGQAGAAI
ncbi:MAG: aminopeptidase P family protein [Paracoccaceae bacterium]